MCDCAFSVGGEYSSCLLACANWHHSGPSVTGAESVGRGLISCARLLLNLCQYDVPVFMLKR